jgi:hypothetical protein
MPSVTHLRKPKLFLSIQRKPIEHLDESPASPIPLAIELAPGNADGMHGRWQTHRAADEALFHHVQFSNAAETSARTFDQVFDTVHIFRAVPHEQRKCFSDASRGDAGQVHAFNVCVTRGRQARKQHIDLILEENVGRGEREFLHGCPT